MSEREWTCAGQMLTEAQAETVRVALEALAVQLRAKGLGEDAEGKALCAGYLDRIDELRALLHEPGIESFSFESQDIKDRE